MSITANEAARARDARYRERQPERVRLLTAARQKRRYDRDPDKARAAVRRYYREHRDEILAKQKASRPRYALLAARSRALKASLPFDLDVEWFSEQEKRGSALSGIPFSRERVANRHYPYGPSIDRIEAPLGYVKSNCRLILSVENSFKGVLSDAEVLRIARAIVAKSEGG